MVAPSTWREAARPSAASAYRVVFQGDELRVEQISGGVVTTQVLSSSVAANKTYLVSVITGPGVNSAEVRIKGESTTWTHATASGAIDWDADDTGRTRSLSVETRSQWASPTRFDNFTNLDNLSEWSVSGLDTRYFHMDHLGSVVAVTDGAGSVVERMSFDAWGKRRNPDGTDDTGNLLRGATTPHGYTLHEHLDAIGLVHMNGRIYDPLVGRFLSADPNVFYPGNMQDFNRYSYVHNNPLSYTDPSGFSVLMDDAELAGIHGIPGLNLNALLTPSGSFDAGWLTSGQNLFPVSSYTVSTSQVRVSYSYNGEANVKPGGTYVAESSAPVPHVLAEKTDYSFGPTDYSAPPTLLDMLLYDSASEEQSRLQRWDALDRQFASIVSSNAVVGHKYESAGNGPEVFDCSGAVYFGLQQVAPGFSRDMSADGYFRSEYFTADYGGTQAGTGRVRFYNYDPSNSTDIDHATVDLGDGTMVHPSQGKGSVMIVPSAYMDGYKDNVNYYRRLNWDHIFRDAGK